MEVLSEQSEQQRLLHCMEIPGLFVGGNLTAPLTLALRDEAKRFQSCYDYLPLLSFSACTVVERIETSAMSAPCESACLFAADLDWNAEKIKLACLLLKDSCKKLEECYTSFPQPDYDYEPLERRLEWRPTSGTQALNSFVERLQSCFSLYDLKWNSEQDWLENLNTALKTLEKKTEFLENRLFCIHGNFWCTGRWLRYLNEQCQLTGRRMYRVGIRAFGRTQIRDPFLFETQEDFQ